MKRQITLVSGERGGEEWTTVKKRQRNESEEKVQPKERESMRRWRRVQKRETRKKVKRRSSSRSESTWIALNCDCGEREWRMQERDSTEKRERGSRKITFSVRQREGWIQLCNKLIGFTTDYQTRSCEDAPGHSPNLILICCLFAYVTLSVSL